MIIRNSAADARVKYIAQSRLRIVKHKHSAARAMMAVRIFPVVLSRAWSNREMGLLGAVLERKSLHFIQPTWLES